MNIADRIQHLRKIKGISQEELADQIGVSRQTVSKWESEQSSPDIEKVVVMSDYFGVTTDYLLKGIEDLKEERKKIDARIMALAGSVSCVLGLLICMVVWIETQQVSSLITAFCLDALGILLYLIGQTIGTNAKEARKKFWIVTIWPLALIPYAFLFNLAQGLLQGHAPRVMPYLERGNSLALYLAGWIVYIALCAAFDLWLIGRQPSKQEK